MHVSFAVFVASLVLAGVLRAPVLRRRKVQFAPEFGYEYSGIAPVWGGLFAIVAVFSGIVALVLRFGSP